MNDKNNGKTQILTTLASSGNAWIQFGTLAMIAISGILNFEETREAAKDNRKLFERQTAEIWAALDRNKSAVQQLYENASVSRKLLSDRVNDEAVLLKNQEQILRNQQTALELLQKSHEK